MAFTRADRNEVERFLQRATTAADEIGKLKRDARLMSRLYPDWPRELIESMGSLSSLFDSVLVSMDDWEKLLAKLINKHAPREK